MLVGVGVQVEGNKGEKKWDNCNSFVNKKYMYFLKSPWLVWLSGLNASLQTERSPVLFPVRVHAWVAGRVPSWGHARGNQSMCLLHINISLPLFLPPSLSLSKNK